MEDEESGPVGNSVFKVGTYPGGGDIEGMTEAADDYIRSSIASGDGLPNYVTVRAENGAGLGTTVTSEPVVMDTTPPEVEEVCY